MNQPRQATARMLRIAMPVLAAALLFASAGALAVSPSSVFVQAGAGLREDGVGAASLGVTWPWAWRTGLAGGEVSGATELFASQWRAHAPGGGRQSVAQLGLVPMVRWRPADGRSAWFVEGGIGVSVTDRRFSTPGKAFSTRLNFSDTLAFGRNFGIEGRDELSLRWQHTSNGSFKQPNPGLDLLFIRYSTRF